MVYGDVFPSWDDLVRFQRKDSLKVTFDQVMSKAEVGYLGLSQYPGLGQRSASVSLIVSQMTPCWGLKSNELDEPACSPCALQRLEGEDSQTMSANKNKPALTLEAAAEWTALKMQWLFSTISRRHPPTLPHPLAFEAKGELWEKRLDTIFLCFQPGPDWQAAWKFLQNALRTKRGKQPDGWWRWVSNPLNGVTRLLKAPSRVVSFDCFLFLEWNVFRSFSRLLILFISLGKMVKLSLLGSHSLLRVDMDFTLCHECWIAFSGIFKDFISERITCT